MIFHGRKSHEKCYVEELARRLARFAGRIRRCDKGILRRGRNIIHPSVTDLVKSDLVGYFALPGEILTSLVPGGFSKRPWSILLLPGEQFSFPGDVC